MWRWAATAAVMVVLSGDGASDEPPLAKAQQTQLSEIVYAVSLGDPVLIVQTAAPVATKVSDEDFAEMNTALADQELPSIGQMLVFARMQVDEAKLGRQVPKLTIPERVRMLAAIADEGNDVLAMADESLTVDVTLSEETMRAYDERLRQIDGQIRKLYVALQMAHYGQMHVKRIPPRSRENLEGADAAAVAQNSPERIEELEWSIRNLNELQLALRLARLDYGIEVLQETAGTLTKERFIAAYSTGLDGRFLQELLKKAKTAKSSPKPVAKLDDEAEDDPEKPLFTREELNDPELDTSIAERMKLAEGLAGDLAEKSRHFAEGLEWWLRGRFGSGPEIWGLVKSEQALNDPELLHYVAMPIELPTPTAPTSLTGMRPTHIERRHHYIWNWEDRKLVRGGSDRKWMDEDVLIGLLPGRIIGHNCKGVWYDGPGAMPITADRYRREAFRSVHLPPQDPRLVYRLVGFVEYTKALEDLDQFVKEASLPELEIANEIVQDNEHFIVHTNLSRSLEQKQNVLSEQGKNERDDFARHGLPWVLGLARIELGAMLAGFTSAPDPFQLVVPPQKSERSPERYGADEYLELLVDGMRTHYWSLKGNPAVWSYRKTGVPEEHLVTYTRRVTISRQFLNAVESTGPRVLNAAQHQLMGEWSQEIASVHRMLIYCLAKKQGQERFAVQQFQGGGFWKTNPEMSRQLSRSPLPDILELIDPTLKFCPCR